MKRSLVALAAAAALLPQPAYAGDDSTHTGSCHVLDGDVLGGQSPSGEELWLYAVVALSSPDPAGNPVTGTVTCELRVNGTPAGSASETGAGAVVVTGSVVYYATPADVVELCTTVDYADGTPTFVSCAVLPILRIPPDGHTSLVDTVVEAIETYVDPAACAAFRALAPGAEPVRITPEGDVHVGDVFVWDCPPYET